MVAYEQYKYWRYSIIQRYWETQRRNTEPRKTESKSLLVSMRPNILVITWIWDLERRLGKAHTHKNINWLNKTERIKRFIHTARNIDHNTIIVFTLANLSEQHCLNLSLIQLFNSNRSWYVISADVLLYYEHAIHFQTVTRVSGFAQEPAPHSTHPRQALHLKRNAHF